MVVKRQPVDDLVHGLALRGEGLAVQPAHLEVPPQAFRRRIVPAVALAAHRRLHAVALERVLELAATVLAAPVRVEDQSGRWLAPEPRHAQGIRDQAGLHVRLHAPAHHLAADQVDHGGQVQPAIAGGDIGDVAGPDPVGRIHRELAVEQVGRNGQRMFAVGRDDKLSLAPRFDAVHLHGLLHPLPAHTKASAQQLFPHAGPAVLALDLGVNHTDVGQQIFIADSPAGLAGCSLCPAPLMLEVATGADLQNLATQRDRPDRFVPGDPGVLHLTRVCH